VCSARYGMATEVSRPPEYARTTRSLMTVSPWSLHGAPWCAVFLGRFARASRRRRAPLRWSFSVPFVPAGPAGQLRRQPLTAGVVVLGAGHDEDGVVAGDGADDLGQAGPVQGAGQKLGGSGWGTQDDQVAAGVHAGEQLAQQPDQPGRRLLGGAHRAGALGGYHVDGRAAVGAADLDRAQLLQVARQGRLGRLYPLAGQQFGKLGLRVHGPVPDQRDDAGVPGGAGERCGHHRSPGAGGSAAARAAPAGGAGCASSQVSSAFCAGNRFSAWSNTALCGPSITSSVISSPRWAGRQCSTMAPGAAAPSSLALTWYGRKGANRSRPSLSWPIEVHVSVAMTSAPSTASYGSRSVSTEPPVHA